mmetsp:Transcript_19331/g.74238  ORF Transcript_19331/g.74238 Transcript_19331/m.74238 type:complete len:218 (+) Transcript_19331:242-895(+)
MGRRMTLSVNRLESFAAQELSEEGDMVWTEATHGSVEGCGRAWRGRRNPSVLANVKNALQGGQTLFTTLLAESVNKRALVETVAGPHVSVNKGKEVPHHRPHRIRRFEWREVLVHLQQGRAPLNHELHGLYELLRICLMGACPGRHAQHRHDHEPIKEHVVAHAARQRFRAHDIASANEQCDHGSACSILFVPNALASSLQHLWQQPLPRLLLGWRV